MDTKFRITLIGILLVLITTRHIQCASLKHIRKIREAELSTTAVPSITEQNTNSSPFNTTTTKTDLSTEDEPLKDSSIENKIKSKVNDASSSIENEHSKIQATTSDPNEKPLSSRGNKKHPKEEKKETTTQGKDRSEEESTTSKNGRSLNIDIDKYISPEFHNKNNVYSMPTSPEIEKYLESDPESHETTNEPKKTHEIQTDFSSLELTTPHSNLFDPKFRLAVDRITQNLDEISSNTEQFKEDEDDTEKYEVSKLIDEYKNADNDTEINLHATEYKNIDLKTDTNKQNKDMESGKNVDFESKYLKTKVYGEKPESNNNTSIEASDTQITKQIASTTVLPTKKSRTQISLRNNTIETTAPDSDIKSKSLKPTDPQRELEKATYTKPTYENAINISKRGSTKVTTTSERTTATTVANYMDYDNKNFSIPPTATAWTLVSLKEVPSSSTSSLKENQSVIDADQNSQENHLVKVPVTTPGKQIGTTTEKISETTKGLGNNIDYSTTTDSTDPTSADNTESESNKMIKKTTEALSTTLRDDFTTETEVTTEQIDTSTMREGTTEADVETTTKYDYTTETTTAVNEETTMYTTTEIPTTTMSSYASEETTTELYTTQTPETTTDSTTIDEYMTSTSEETTKSYIKSTTKSTTTPPLEDEDMDSGGEDNDYPEVTMKKNVTEVNSPEIENVSVDIPQTIQSSTKPTVTPTIVVHKPTTPSNFAKDSKPIFPNPENVTVDATSSTEPFSHDDDNDDNNTGMIAAITISSIGGVCLILLAGLLLIMRKRQKRVTYGQRCRPVSLDAYSLDNVSVYNSVRRKGALRASKRSYGNPAFEDPVSTSHQMNFQQLAKFVDNAEAMSAEFEEIPQVTARANEVPDGCETKNRYANVIPLPETRVFLKPFDNDPQSDYINANYVTGPKNIRGYYIATQGPMNSTVDDFWRMIWEQQCRVILMLTNLYENGIEKCADYLPPSEVLDCHRLFGDFQITLKKREVKEKYIISSLQLKNMVSNSWREVTHLWYIGWPERGVPMEANSLIAFLIEARSHLKAASNNNSDTGNIHMGGSGSGSSASSSESGPLVVHCSPGTGRTGTVIACDIAIRDFELTRNVDIPKIVYKVRRDRASAVQTKEQYSFIYKVISLYATKLTGGALESI